MSESQSAKTPETATIDAGNEEVNQAIKLLAKDEDEKEAKPKQVVAEENVTKSGQSVKSSEETLTAHANASESGTANENDKANKKEMKSKQKPNETETKTKNGTTNDANDDDDGKGDDFNAYAEHVTYESDGSAIYTDPSTKYKYKWSTAENNWLPLDVDGNETVVEENEHYKWCAKTQQWLPKQPQQQQPQQQQVTETEHYKWDAEKHEWVAKANIVNNSKTNSTTTTASEATAAVTYGVDEEGQRIYTDSDGVVFVWDADKGAWFPKIDDDFMARYQMNYGFIDNTSAGEQEKREREQQEAKRKEEELKRMADEARAAMAAMSEQGGVGGASSAVGHKRKAQEPPKWFDLDPMQNTKVYVSNLPLDITIDEFAELMGKCGMIMRDQQTQKYKLKLYTEKDGQIKGDGLCDYIKVESVDLALNILDEYELRGHKIHVQRAKFQMRGEYNPALKPKRKKKDKEKLQKIKEKLFDWRPDKMRGERSKNEKTVIIKNLFTPELFEKEVQLILDYQNDLREECGKCGTVRKVVIYDRHPEGVAQVNMTSPEEADLVIQMMQGRFFGKRQLTAECWDGKTKYKIDESASEAQKRLSKWDQFLETDEASETQAVEEDKKSTEDNLPAVSAKV